MRSPARWPRRRWLAWSLGIGGALAGHARAAWAHDPFVIATAATIHADRVDVVVTMAESTAVEIVSGAKASPGGAPWGELGPSDELLAVSSGLYVVRVDGRELSPSQMLRSSAEPGDVELRLTYPRPSSGHLHLLAAHLSWLPTGYGNLVRVSDESGRLIGLKYLGSFDPTFAVALPALEARASPGATEPAGESGAITSLWSFLVLGIEHVLLGCDHLLFLAGLLIGCHRLRPMLGLVTCFALAHSVTLALAVLDVVRAPPHLVEPAIAASIVFIAVQNVVFPERPSHRYPLTFAFGLVHGLGFAGALVGLGLGPATSKVVPLVSFNLGVELGQAGIAALAVPAVVRLRRGAPGSGDRAARVASLVIGLAGGYWLVERTLLR